MAHEESSHLRLQQQIDCQLEIEPRSALAAWERNGWNEEPGTDGDEAPLKYLALVMLDAIEQRATRVAIDKDDGAIVYSDTTYSLPKAPDYVIARGLEILREISGMQRPDDQGTLALGIRDDSLELILQKERGLHIVNFPGIGQLH
ncbi:MAG: hypothetical protein AB1646_18870 [Thermodesulfobacteriota bacterium]